MAIVTGQVSVDIAISGSGDGAAKTERATKAVEKLKQEVGAAGTAAGKSAQSTKSLADSVAGFKDGLRPLDGVRSGFEMLRSNLLGFPTAIAGAVGGLVAMAEKLVDMGSASERLREKAQDYAAAIAGARKDLEELARLNGHIAATPGPLGADAGDRFSELTDKLSTLKDALREAQAPAAALNELTGGMVASLTESDAQYLRIAKITNEIRETEALIKGLRDGSYELILRQEGALRRIAGLAAGGLAGGAKGVKTPPAPRGGGGGFDAEAAWREKVAAATRERERGGLSMGGFRALERNIESEVFGTDAANDNAGTSRGRRRGNTGGIAASMEAINSRPAQEIAGFSAALVEALPGIGAFNVALSQLAETWTAWGEGSLTTRDAVIGSLGAIAKAGAQELKNERLRAGVLSIIELGLGFANLANPPVAAGHFTASAILGGVALFGSGSGSSRGAGGGAGGGGTPRPVRLGGEMLGQRAVAITIQNYYGGRSEQEAGADFLRLTRRTDGTGFERGRAA